MWTTNDTEPADGGAHHTVVDVPKTKFERQGQVLRHLAWGGHEECKDWVAVTVDDTLEVVHV